MTRNTAPDSPVKNSSDNDSRGVDDDDSQGRIALRRGVNGKKSLREFIHQARLKAAAMKSDAAGRPHKVRVRYSVFIGSAVALSAMSIWTLTMPVTVEEVIGVGVSFVGRWFGAYYILLGTVILVFVLAIAFSRYGNVRLGPDHSRPQFSTFAWASMLFAAGIGTDVMFYSVYEPLAQYSNPPHGRGETVEAARQAVVWTLFHYGLTGWAMYALMGMSLAYFAYRLKKPLAVRSALYPLIGRRVEGAIGDTVDSAAILGTIFGIATSLGIGVTQLNYGLNILFHLPQGLGVQISLTILAVLISLVSATTGINRGIRLLSQLNVILAMVLAAWILVTGKTAFLINSLVMNIGDLISRFPTMTLDTMAYYDVSEWMSWWTLFFWAWWVAWASFVGMFLARISRGRRLREFIFGCLIFPFLYILMWISLFGNSAIDYVRNSDHTLADTTLSVPESGFYTLIQQYPAPMFLVGLATVVGLLFYVTSADSGALVMANLCSILPNAHQDARAWTRIFWAVITGILTIGMLVVGGINALTNATIIMGLPFSFVLIAVMAGLVKSLKKERHVHDVRVRSALNIDAGRGVPSDDGSTANWRRRLSKAIDVVTPAQALQEMVDTVEPALRDIVEELRAQSLDAVLMNQEEGREYLKQDPDPDGPFVHDMMYLVVKDDEYPFYYQVSVIEVTGFAYVGFVGHEGDTTARIEVSVADSEYNYDILGYTKDQVIHDVVNQFEEYVEFKYLSYE